VKSEVPLHTIAVDVKSAVINDDFQREDESSNNVQEEHFIQLEEHNVDNNVGVKPSNGNKSNDDDDDDDVTG
jgi:hypothetical protein